MDEPANDTVWTDGYSVWKRSDLEAHAYRLGQHHWFCTRGGHVPKTWAEICAERDPSKWTQLVPVIPSQEGYALIPTYAGSDTLRKREIELFPTLEEAETERAEYESYGTKRGHGYSPEKYRLFRLEEIPRAE